MSNLTTDTQGAGHADQSSVSNEQNGNKRRYLGRSVKRGLVILMDAALGNVKMDDLTDEQRADVNDAIAYADAGGLDVDGGKQ